MRFSPSHLLALGLGCCLVTPLDGQTPRPGAAEPDGQVRAQVTLGRQPVTVSFAPELRADGPEHRPLLSARGAASGTRVRVASIESVALLRIGTLDGSPPEEPAEDAPARRSVTYDLWLTRDGGDWALDAVWMSADGTAANDGSGTIPLSHSSSTEAFETFSAGIAPTGDHTGDLALRWGGHIWTAGFHFADPPTRPAESEERPQQAPGGGAREFEDDRTARAIARGTMLAERNEAAIELPDESRIGVLFWQEVGADHADFATIASLGDGDVIRLTEAAVLRLRTEVPLRFGQVDVPTDNLAEGFPGSYALWLKRAGAGWRLVLNDEADSWGTQHHTEFDAGEIALTHSASGLAIRPLGVELIPISATSGRLVIHWGPHDWAADFEMAS